MRSIMNLQECYRASNERSGCDYYRRRGRGGFTLAEILVALGILAIGMAMVAAIFPAALEFNRSSTNNTLGTIICENGLVLSELALTTEIIDKAYGEDPKLTIFADDKNKSHLNEKQQHYPTDVGSARTGFVMMARKIPDPDDPEKGATYQLITVAYRKTKKGNTAALVEVSCTIEDGKEITASPKNTMKIGTPLINRDTGEFAIVNSINDDGTKGTLDIDPDERNTSGIENGSSYYVLVEQGTGTDEMRRSPAIQTMVKVTGIRSK